MKTTKAYISLFLGIVMFAIGLYLSATNAIKIGALYLPSLFFGMGGGLLGSSLGRLSRIRALESDPEAAKNYRINSNDERLIRLREKSGYATWYSTLIMLGLLSIVMLMLGYQTASWLAIGAMLLHSASFYIYMYVYTKKM